MLYYIVLSIGTIVSFIFCCSRSSGFSVKNLVFKAASSLCFMLTAVFATILNGSAHIFGSLIIMGGALGLVGDIALDLKGVYKQDESTYLKCGFIFFSIGHIFYTGAMVYLIKIKWYIVLACALLSLIIGIVTVASANLMKVHYGAYRKIVVFYVAFLVMTMLTSFVYAYLAGFTKPSIVMAVGAVLFLLSDLILSGTYFGRGKDKPYHFFINHFLYYAAQYLIASSVMFIK